MFCIVNLSYDRTLQQNQWIIIQPSIRWDVTLLIIEVKLPQVMVRIEFPSAQNIWLVCWYNEKDHQRIFLTSNPSLDKKKSQKSFESFITKDKMWGFRKCCCSMWWRRGMLSISSIVGFPLTRKEFQSTPVVCRQSECTVEFGLRNRHDGNLLVNDSLLPLIRDRLTRKNVAIFIRQKIMGVVSLCLGHNQCVSSWSDR